MNHLRKLNFGDIVEFKLIKEKLHSVSIFIEIDEKAKGIRKKIEDILSRKDRFERQEDLLEIKRDINQYTLSINVSREDVIRHLPPLGKKEDFKYIPHKNLENWYELDTGFQVPETDIDLRML